MALGSTQPLTEMSTGAFLGGKGGRCVRLTTLPPPSCAVVMKSGNLNFLEPSGHSRPVTGLLYLLPYEHLLVHRHFPCPKSNFRIWMYFRPCNVQSDDNDNEGDNSPSEEQVLPLKCGSGQIFGKENSKSKSLQRSCQSLKCLLTFSPESCLLVSATWKLEQRISTFFSG